MEHVVFFTGPSGPGFRRVPDLAEALASVEHLRNVAGIDDATVHALTLVPLQFKTYVKVEVTGQVAQELAAEQTMAEHPMAEHPMAEHAMAEPLTAEPEVDVSEHAAMAQVPAEMPVSIAVPAIEPPMEPMAANGVAPISLEEFAPSADDVPGVPDADATVAEVEAELPMQRSEVDLVPAMAPEMALAMAPAEVAVAGAEAPEAGSEGLAAGHDASHDPSHDPSHDLSHDLSHDVLPEPHPVRAGRGMGFFQR